MSDLERFGRKRSECCFLAVVRSGSVSLPHGRAQVLVQLGDHVERDLLGAGGRALTDVGAASEALVVVLRDHVDHEGFGGCTNIGECTAACPKEIPLDVISQLNKDLRTAIRHGH